MELAEMIEEIKVVSKKVYFDRFFSLKFENPYITDFGAWVLLEGEYKAIFGASKYSSYESFRVCKHRYLKKLRRKR